MRACKDYAGAPVRSACACGELVKPLLVQQPPLQKSAKQHFFDDGDECEQRNRVEQSVFGILAIPTRHPLPDQQGGDQRNQ